MQPNLTLVKRILSQIDHEPTLVIWLQQHAQEIESILIDVLQGKAADIDDYMIKNALSFLGRVGGAKAVPVLASYTSHRSQVFRVNALRSLGRIRVPASAKALEKVLVDPKLSVAEGKIALRSLANIGYTQLPSKVADLFTKRYKKDKKGVPRLNDKIKEIDELINAVTVDGK